MKGWQMYGALNGIDDVDMLNKVFNPYHTNLVANWRKAIPKDEGLIIEYIIVIFKG